MTSLPGRSRAKAGATRAIARGDRTALPALPVLPLTVELTFADAGAPADAERVPGDALLGHSITDERSRGRRVGGHPDLPASP